MRSGLRASPMLSGKQKFRHIPANRGYVVPFPAREVMTEFRYSVLPSSANGAITAPARLGTSRNLTRGKADGGGRDVDKLFTQSGQTLKFFLQGAHSLLGKFDAGFVEGRHALDVGMLAFPGHG